MTTYTRFDVKDDHFHNTHHMRRGRPPSPSKARKRRYSINAANVHRVRQVLAELEHERIGQIIRLAQHALERR